MRREALCSAMNSTSKGRSRWSRLSLTRGTPARAGVYLMIFKKPPPPTPSMSRLRRTPGNTPLRQCLRQHVYVCAAIALDRNSSNSSTESSPSTGAFLPPFSIPNPRTGSRTSGLTTFHPDSPPPKRSAPQCQAKPPDGRGRPCRRIGRRIRRSPQAFLDPIKHDRTRPWARHEGNRTLDAARKLPLRHTS